MAKISTKRGKLVRKFEENIFNNPKFDKLLAKKTHPSGSRGKKPRRRKRRRLSDYGTQLKEKQKLKITYGVLERQFRKYFQMARKTQAATGEKLLQILESRLDNLVYRASFASTRPAARQLVSHGHIQIDGKKASIPSYLVKPGQVISLNKKGQKIPDVAILLAKAKKDLIIPKWLTRKAIAAKLERLPERDEIDINIQEQLIVEFYSR
ncbi:MAG: 30S ribosomal protein S4 [Patescibacteria group bacterium]|nr:30S ribosomal protein S4 [Patescibacteria group bacterium]